MSKDFKKPTFNYKRFERLKVAISQVEPMDMSFAPMVVNEYELLVMTIYKLNDLIKVTNSYTELINEILEWVLNEGLEQAVLDQLNVWLNDGTLEVLINETLFNMKLDKTEFEDYKVLVNQTLEDLDNDIQSIKSDIVNLNESKMNLDDFNKYFTIIEPNKSALEIQNLINDEENNNFIWLEGEYVLPPLFFGSEQVHHFNPKVLIRSEEGFTDGNKLLNVYKSKDLVLNFNGARVKMNNEVPNEHGGNMHCLTINGSENITVNDVILSDSGGDGLYIGHSQDNEPSINITVENIVCLNNARQGISITDVKGCYINNVLIDGVRGGNPGAGIDIEPNNPYDFIENIFIENVTIRNTDNAGLLIALPFLASNPTSAYPDKYNEVSINLKNFNISDTKLGIHFYHLYKKIGGFINIENFNIKNVKQQGLLFDGWYKGMIPNLNIDGMIIDNVNLENNSVAYRSSAIVMNNEITRENKVNGGFYIKNLEIKETSDVKRMRYTIYGQNQKEENCDLTLINHKGIAPGLNETILFKGRLRFIDSLDEVTKTVNITQQVSLNYVQNEVIEKNVSEVVTLILNGGVVGNEITLKNNSNGILKIRCLQNYSLDNLVNNPGTLVQNYVTNIKGSYIKIKMINETTFTAIEKGGIWEIE